MKTVILENTWLSGITSHGWGNGYVIIPEGHKLHGKHYEELNKRKAISVNGGLTYSMNVIVIVEPNFTVWTSTENDKINFIPK